MSRKPELKGRAARLARLLPARSAQAAKTPFVLLVVLLLGGGLIGLLVLNSALSEGAFQLDDLRKQTKNLTDEQQALQRDIDAYSSPDALQRRARELGMVPGGDPAFLAPGGTVKGVPSPAALRPTATAPLAPEAITAPPRSMAATATTTATTGANATTGAPPASPAATTAAPPASSAPAAPLSAPQPATTTTPGR